jgi:uncharacterized SAM-binding protein YcdF (DUF218 family)
MDKVLVVLGGGVDKDGNMPPWTHARLDKALKEWHEPGYSYLITSGKGRTHNVQITEASSMAQWLAQQGIPMDKILVEEKSTSTIENAYFCKMDYIERLRISNLTIVTNQFHIERAETIFKFVFGPDYVVNIAAADDTGIPDDVRKILTQADAEQSHFLEDHIFKAIRPGDQRAIEDFIFNKDNTGAKKWLEYKATSKLYRQVTRLMT